jgi:hypothetical protein
MIKYLAKYFQNNGHLRGALYFMIASLGSWHAAFILWSKTPPENAYEVLGVIVGAQLSGLVAVRAYLDTHLSRTKNENVPQVPSTGESAGQSGL